jgi:type I restriction enzyme S subunit
MKCKPLKDVAQIIMGQSPDSSSYNEVGEGLPFFQGNADFGVMYPSERIWCNQPKKIANENDILISVRAPIGALNYANKKCCIGRGLAAITVNNPVERNYIFHLLKAKNAELNRKGTGSTFKAIGKNVLEDIPVPIVSSEIQLHITRLMDITESIISKRKNELKYYDELIKARFVEMFGDCKTNPKAWNTVELGNIASVGSSKRVFVDQLKNEGVPFYRGTEVGALAEGKKITPELFITPEHYAELIDFSGKPSVGDLLMPSICPDGRIWVVNTEEPFYFKDGRVLWVHSICKDYDPVFLLYTLKDRIMTDYNSIASGTTFAELKIFTLRQCHVFNVPINLQREFVDFIHQIDKSKVMKRLRLAHFLFADR